MRAWLLLALLSLTVLAGCSDDPSHDGSNDGEAGPTLVDPMAAYNAGEVSANMHRLGQWGEGSAEIDACGNWLFVDAGATVQILDITDPANPEEVADVVGLPDIQDMKASDDCNWLFVGNDEEASAELPVPLPNGQDATRAGGFWVVDVSDKTKPSIVSSLAIGLRRGPHMVYYHMTEDGRELVFGANADISINEFDRATGTLRELSRYQADLVTAYNRDPEVFDVLYQGWAHDMVARNDPDTGKTLMYVANWDAGLRIVDVSDPSNPAELGGWNDFPEGHEGNLHTVSTDVIDGRSITVGSVEVGFAVVGGVHYATNTDRSIVYVWDTTDSANIVLLGQWENPEGKPADRAELDGGEGSTHNLQLEGGRIYLAHYNMGVFVLDVSTPEFQAGPPILGFHREPDDTVWDVVLNDGILYSAGSQGVIALHYAPDVVGEDGIDSNA
ncbi:MAG: LVIVD repeat-containing protein [Thermoplasmatota archaeon]